MAHAHKSNPSGEKISASATETSSWEEEALTIAGGGGGGGGSLGKKTLTVAGNSSVGGEGGPWGLSCTDTGTARWAKSPESRTTNFEKQYLQFGTSFLWASGTTWCAVNWCTRDCMCRISSAVTGKVPGPFATGSHNSCSLAVIAAPLYDCIATA